MKLNDNPICGGTLSVLHDMKNIFKSYIKTNIHKKYKKITAPENVLHFNH